LLADLQNPDTPTADGITGNAPLLPRRVQRGVVSAELGGDECLRPGLSVATSAAWHVHTLASPWARPEKYMTT
ncbi:unnamed protein product, partial [Durusdinium trenchii]